MSNISITIATITDAQDVFSLVIDGLAPLAISVSALGLAVWVGPYSAALLVRAFTKTASETDTWQDMVKDPDALYQSRDGSIRDRSTHEIVFESRRSA